jgi:hypothetical protein
MATNTYVALDKKTIASAVSSVTFTGIDQTYTDLVLVFNGTNNQAVNTADFTLNFNSDSGSNYSRTWLAGNGSAAASNRGANQTTMYLTYYGAPSTSQSNVIANIQNYSNSTTYKTVLARTTNAASGTDAVVGSWRNTAAITSILVTNTVGTFSVGDTFSLYGIRAEGTSPAPKATGGAIYSDSTYYYHVFGSTGTFTPLSSLTADVLVVAGGGGGGGANIGGGGGAGGILYSASQSLSATGYTCTIGAGGAGSTTLSNKGTNGGNSQFGAITASVGGGGGGSSSTVTGSAGGSGGGGSNGAGGNGGAGTFGQGYAGGNGNDSNLYPAGGGGGASAVGQNGDGTNNQRAGGAGLNTWSSWATATGTGDGNGYYAGGGASGSLQTATVLTTRSAGGGGIGITQTLMNALQFTGSGGAGFSYAASGFTGNGASGIVIVRYAK